MGQFNIDTFLPLKDEEFFLEFEEYRVVAKLAEVKTLEKPDEIDIEPFSLVFVTASDVQLWQGTYRVAHKEHDFGEFFLAPIGPCFGGLGMEAIFS